MSVASLERALPAGDTMLLDSAVLICYFKGNESASPVAAHVVDAFVMTGRNRATVSMVTAMELLVYPMQTGDDVLYRQVVFFLSHTPNMDLMPVDFLVAHEAAYVRATLALKPPDALIVATGRVSAVRHLVSNDHEWKYKMAPPSAQRLAVCYLEDHLPFP
jgi:predicted nucleic acid-binding protein